MDRLTLEKLMAITPSGEGEWCVSLFMPTHRAGREAEKNPIHFKNLLRGVEDRLLAKGLRAPEARAMLKAPQQLLNDSGFWHRQSDGLALFFTADTCAPFRLPAAFETLVVVSKRFHFKPLLPLLTADTPFYILALSQNQVRLLEATRYSATTLDLEGVPPSLAEAFPDLSLNRQLQYRTGAPSGAGRRTAVFHGHDISTANKDRMMRWFRMIDRKINELLAEGAVPLVLAGVEALFPLYREVNTYGHLVDTGIAGNPEGMSPDALHTLAWGTVAPLFQQAQEEARARYRQLAGTGQTTIDVKEAVLAATHGRVEVLFVAVGMQVWGLFDGTHDAVAVHASHEAGDDDLLDLAAMQALIKGGTVYAVAPDDVPDQAPLAAILRY